MHHLRETVIDGVKFVLIPEELHDVLAKMIHSMAYHEFDTQAATVAFSWKEYDAEVFLGL